MFEIVVETMQKIMLPVLYLKIIEMIADVENKYKNGGYQKKSSYIIDKNVLKSIKRDILTKMNELSRK